MISSKAHVRRARLLPFLGFQGRQDAAAANKCPPGGRPSSGRETVIATMEFGVVRDVSGTYFCSMAKTPDKSMSLFTALASAAVAAYALAYIAHAEWGMSRVVIREDAMGMAGILVAAIGVRIVFRRKNTGS
jgi:hypothetical protein